MLESNISDIIPTSIAENIAGNYDIYLKSTLPHILFYKKFLEKNPLQQPLLSSKKPKISLPENKKILILDLDETLIHAEFLESSNVNINNSGPAVVNSNLGTNGIQQQVSNVQNMSVTNQTSMPNLSNQMPVMEQSQMNNPQLNNNSNQIVAPNINVANMNNVQNLIVSSIGYGNTAYNLANLGDEYEDKGI